MTYLIANWKSHKTKEDIRDWFEEVAGTKVSTHTRVVVCPPFPYLEYVDSLIQKTGLLFELGMQDISPFPFGAYTGAVAEQRRMVRGMVDYVVVGHSERRRYFHETNQDVANKVTEALNMRITPIVCVDEPYAIAQMAALEREQLGKVLVAYEPLEAIGSGDPDTPKHAAEVAMKIKEDAKFDFTDFVWWIGDS